MLIDVIYAGWLWFKWVISSEIYGFLNTSWTNIGGNLTFIHGIRPQRVIIEYHRYLAQPIAMRRCLISKTDSFKANNTLWKNDSTKVYPEKEIWTGCEKRVSFTVSDSLQGGPPVISWFVNPNLVGGWAYPSEKYESQLGLWLMTFPRYGKIQNVPNHQPGIVTVTINYSYYPGYQFGGPHLPRFIYTLLGQFEGPKPKSWASMTRGRQWHQMFSTGVIPPK